MISNGNWVPISMENAVKPAIPYGKEFDINNYNITIQNYTIYSHVRVIPSKRGTEPKVIFLNKPYLPAYKFPTKVMHVTNGDLYMEINIPTFDSWDTTRTF